MSEREFTGFEYDLGDQRACELVKKAAFISEYINEVSVPDIEVRRLVDDLNSEWREHGMVHSAVNITGECWLVSDEDIDANGDPVLHDDSYMQLVDQEVLAGVFEFRENITVDDNGVSSEYAIFLSGETLVVDELEGSDDYEYVQCLIPVSKETMIRYDHITPDRAERWLDMYYPEEKYAIIDACMNAEDEAQATLNLRGFSVDVEGLREDAIMELGRYLEVYMNDALSYEQHLPYLVRIEGDMGIRLPGEHSYRLAESVAMKDPVFMANIEAHIVYNEQDVTLEPWLYAAVIPSEGRRALHPCRFSVDAVASVDSVRPLAEIV